MTYNIWILGNGFDINIVPGLQNFNENFKKWINSIEFVENCENEKSETLPKNFYTLMKRVEEDLLINLDSESKVELINSQKFVDLQEHIKDIIEELQQRFNEIDDIDFRVENFLRDVGTHIRSQVSAEMVDNVFLAVKTLFGFFINQIVNQNEIDKFNKFSNNTSEYIKDAPNEIITTNYTELVNVIPTILSNSKGVSKRGNVHPLYIHGKFGSGFEKYKKIELNLIEKNISKIDGIMDIKWRVYNLNNCDISISIFGNCIYKEEHLIEFILSLFKRDSLNKIKIILYLYDDGEQEKILSTFLDKLPDTLCIIRDEILDSFNNLVAIFEFKKYTDFPLFDLLKKF